MTIFEFGDAKLRANDLDPLYTAVHRSTLSLADRCRFTLAEVSFDLAGKAADVVEQAQGEQGDAFWAAMHDAADDTARGAPRRYFRGEKCHDAISWMAGVYPDALDALNALRGTFQYAHELVCDTWPLWGPTAAFKISDMAERVCGVAIDFSAVGEEEICSNVQVRKGWDKAKAILGVADLGVALREHAWETLASPRYDRPLNAQEWETLLCYYSHDDATNRHMPGMDRVGIADELWDHGRLAGELIELLPWADQAEFTRWKGTK